jgi:hypothetical protein
MVLDARSRSSIYQKLVPTLGEDDANTLMSQFPSVEADELVTKQFLRAELAEFRSDVRSEFADVLREFRGELAELRLEMHREMHRQTVWLGSALAGATALLATLGFLT